jgi:hypothetical protein
MMTAMTSLTTAASAAPAAPAFNANFYVVAATVVPVLFLALAVQSRGYQNLLDALAAIDRISRHLGRWCLQAGGLVISLCLLISALLIVLYAADSEVTAIYALYQQQADRGTAQAVLFGTILMIIATAAGPAIAFINALIASTPRVSRRLALTASRSIGPDLDKLASAMASEQQHGGERHHTPELGKTDNQPESPGI